MRNPVRFNDSIEPLVAFVEETDPADIIEQTYQRLCAETDPDALLAAAALAVTRSSGLPDVHHGGPLHPLTGLHAVHHTAKRLPGPQRFLPIIQSVTLANKHIHDPKMGPYLLPEIAPTEPADPEASREAFHAAARRSQATLAERHFVDLLRNREPVECLDALMTHAIPRNPIDDHYFIFPAFTYRAAEWLGWEHTQVLLRPAAHFVCRRLNTLPGRVTFLDSAESIVAEVRALLAEYDLLRRVVRRRTGPDETERVGRLGETIGGVSAFPEIPPLLAAALAEGLSLEGAGEALSIGVSFLFLRSTWGNPMDAHMHTGVNLRRYLIGLDGIGLENKLLALLLWQTGPEIQMADAYLRPALEPSPGPLRANRPEPADLLDALTECIENQPKQDLSIVYDTWTAKPEVDDACALARQYLDLGSDPEALILRLAEIAARDSFTEMHALKHHQAAVEEYRRTRAPWNTRHLICAARAAAVTHGVDQRVYLEARQFLRA